MEQERLHHNLLSCVLVQSTSAVRRFIQLTMRPHLKFFNRLRTKILTASNDSFEHSFLWHNRYHISVSKGLTVLLAIRIRISTKKIQKFDYVLDHAESGDAAKRDCSLCFACTKRFAKHAFELKAHEL